MDDGMWQRMWQRMQSMVAIGRFTGTADEGPTQRAQVALGPNDVRDGLPVLQQYGLISNPLPGAEAVVLFFGGSRTDGIVIASGDRRFRLRASAPGEVGLYTDEGDSIILKRGRVIEVTAATKVLMNTPLVEVTGDVVAGGISLRNHVHTNVQSGGGTSGPPAT